MASDTVVLRVAMPADCPVDTEWNWNFFFLSHFSCHFVRLIHTQGLVHPFNTIYAQDTRCCGFLFFRFRIIQFVIFRRGRDVGFGIWCRYTVDDVRVSSWHRGVYINKGCDHWRFRIQIEFVQSVDTRKIVSTQSNVSRSRTIQFIVKTIFF